MEQAEGRRGKIQGLNATRRDQLRKWWCPECLIRASRSAATAAFATVAFRGRDLPRQSRCDPAKLDLAVGEPMMTCNPKGKHLIACEWVEGTDAFASQPASGVSAKSTRPAPNALHSCLLLQTRSKAGRTQSPKSVRGRPVSGSAPAGRARTNNRSTPALRRSCRTRRLSGPPFRRRPARASATGTSGDLSHSATDRPGRRIRCFQFPPRFLQPPATIRRPHWRPGARSWSRAIRLIRAPPKSSLRRSKPRSAGSTFTLVSLIGLMSSSQNGRAASAVRAKVSG